jgi:hypothetical protein
MNACSSLRRFQWRTLIQRSACFGSYGFERGHFNDAAEDFIKPSSNKPLTQRHFYTPAQFQRQRAGCPIVAQNHHPWKIIRTGGYCHNFPGIGPSRMLSHIENWCSSGAVQT